MHDLALKQSFFTTLVFSLIISLSWHADIATPVQGESPSFVRQEIIDSSGDWIFWKGSSSSFQSNMTQLNTHEGNIVEVEKADNPSECEIGKGGNYIPPPDIQSVSYISDGKKLNATVWLTSPFEEPPLNDTIDIFQEEFKILISPTNGTLREYTDVNLARLLDPSFETGIQQNATTLSGNQAHRVVYNDRIGENDVKVMQIWTVIGNKAYDIFYTAIPTKYEEYLPKIQELIDTFEIESPTANSSLGNQLNMTGEFLRYEASGIKINYPFDWVKEETKNNDVTTIIFRSPFEDTKLERPSWHEITFTMAVDIDSVHDAGTDYRVIYSRIPDNMWTGNWTRQVREISAYDKTRILEEYNHTYFYDKRDPSHILFSFDLDDANSPKQYKAVFYATDYFVKDHIFCTLTDTTNWVIIPPPDFSMSSEPSSVLLRPGEEKNFKLEIKGNTDLESEAVLNSLNSYADDIKLNISPNKTSISPSASGSSTLHLKVLEGVEPKAYSFPVIANISFPTSITNRGGETFSNNRSVSIIESSNLTLTVLPPYTDAEKLSNFSSAWITPIQGIWTFLAGIGAVIAPLVIALYRKKRKRNSADNPH